MTIDHDPIREGAEFDQEQLAQLFETARAGELTGDTLAGIVEEGDLEKLAIAGALLDVHAEARFGTREVAIPVLISSLEFSSEHNKAKLFAGLPGNLKGATT